MLWKKVRITLALALVPFSAIAAEPAPGQLWPEDVLAYVEELVQWQRDAVAMEPTAVNPRERVFAENLEQGATKVLRRVFEFARLQAGFADIVPNEDPTGNASVGERIRARSTENDQLIFDLQKQLRKQNLTRAQRQASAARLKLAQAKQELFRNVLANLHAAGTGKGLAGQIEKLAQGVAELSPDAARPVTTVKTESDPAAGRRVTSILTLIGDAFEIARKQRELTNFQAQTAVVKEHSRNMLKPLRESLDRITESDTQAGKLDEQLANFKRIGAVIIPLGDASFGVSATQAILEDWRKTLDHRMQDVMRRLALQLVVLVLTLLVPLAIGDVVRRAINRYVTEPRRKRLLHNVRRIVVSLVVLLILLVNFISDFSSFATFAGFLTAGLAVALQSVLLSLVAHFFFYGRYGVRPGDRVKVVGVVGDIVQIGVVRFYLRELREGEGGELAATGKIVAFPNSILFQPSAFYKYVNHVP